VAAGQPLVFGSRSANAPIEFLNPINLGGSGLQGMLPPVQAFVFGAKSAGATLEYPPPGPRGGTVRTIRVDDNPASAADVAVLSGVLSGASDMGLDKTGNGTLFLSATNRYTGDTTVSAGSIGGSGRLAGSLFFGTNTSFVVDVGIANGPLVVAGFADLGNAATLTMRGVPPASVRYPVLQALAGFMGTGRFAHVNLPPGWVVDYSASGEIAIKPDSE
jgi:autotransporter-associated beta strand protein